MKLLDWLNRKGLKPYRFALDNHFGMSTIYGHVYRDAPLGPRISCEIMKITDGEVTLSELMITDKEWPDRRRKQQ